MELWKSDSTNRGAIEFAAGWDNKPRPAYDNLLIPYQIRLDGVYSGELLRLGYIDEKQHSAIVKGLTSLLRRYDKGRLSVEGHEDVQSLVESELNDKYGLDMTGNMHLGLSRNDQIVTLMRMWMKDQASKVSGDLEKLTGVLEQEIPKKEKSVFVGYTHHKEISRKEKCVFVGYSHHRVAMPTTYGELLKSYLSQLKRDRKAMQFWTETYDKCALGAGAGFGSPIEMDWGFIAGMLGFREAVDSSIDAVTTRWEAEVKIADTMKVMMNHLSTIAQDMIIYSMQGIDLIELPKQYCTGSSLMPQKLNPDVFETIKRKAIDIEGEAFKLSSVGRGNISGYNRDTQGAKYWIMNVFMEVDGCLEILSDILPKIKVNEKKARKLLKDGGAYAAAEATRNAIENKIPWRVAKSREEKRVKK